MLDILSPRRLLERFDYVGVTLGRTLNVDVLLAKFVFRELSFGT